VSTRLVEAGDIRAVTVEIGDGTVRLNPTESSGVTGEIRCSDAGVLDRIEVSTFGGTLRIATPKRLFGNSSIQVDLAVPVGIDLELASGSADLVADVELGKVVLRSGSGDLQVTRCAELSAISGSGDIAALEVDGDVRVTTGSGDLRVDACGGGLELRTASGDVVIGSVTGQLDSKTASGDVRVAATSGQVGVKTASGDISIGVADELPAWLDLSTASGDVRVELNGTAEPAPGEPYVSIHARSGSGDITIRKA